MRQLIRQLYPKEVDFHRFENCVNYGDCLIDAGKLQWISFSCRGCEDYEKTTEYEPVFAMSTVGDYIYPASAKYKGDIATFTKKLTEKMRELGIPVSGYKK